MMIDYRIYELAFPNRSTPAMVFLNEDGSFDIYLNALYPEAQRRRALEHELRHIKAEHFYADVSVAQAERQAEGENVNIVSHPPERSFPHFYSEPAFVHWLKNVSLQTHADLI